MMLAPFLSASDETSTSPIALSLQTIWLLCVLVFLINYTFEVFTFNHLYASQRFLLALLQLSLSVWALTEMVLLERRQTAISLKGLRLALIAQMLIGASRLPLGWLKDLGQVHLGHFPSHLDLGLALVYFPLYLLVFLLISKLLINAFSLLERQSALRLHSEIAIRRSAEAALDRSHQARQQVEGEVRDLRAQLERVAFELTENIPVGTYTMVLRPGDPLGKFSFMSRRFLELTGLDRELASSDPLKAFACVHPDDYAAWVKLNAQAFATKQRFFGETRIIVAGEVRWITAESIPRDLPDGSTVWEGVLIDVTEQVLAKQAAQQARQALQEANAELQRLATTDRLTGVWNRTHLEETLVAELGRAERYQQPVSLLMIDVDHFKAINDTHGHLVGDEVLIELTRRLGGHLRSVDVLARWGGEEFMVLLPNCTATEAQRVAEKLRLLVADQPFPTAGRVTASFGLAQLQPPEPLDKWLQRTDEALYAAKKGGRDRVCVAQVAAA